MALSEKISIESFFLNNNPIPLVDVRSPGEFEHAHIPGALNIPLFDNEERATVGTIYKNSGKDDAILKGLQIVGPKMVRLVQEVKKIAPERKINIHCWRGGMRSESMAWLFETSGVECLIIEGGYKAYRQYLKKELAKQASFVILGGMTGSGKTRILGNLKKLGQQILDLESLAHHKGSAFGGIGQELQPSTEQFENNLYDIWRGMDHAKTVWLEDESKSVGGVKIPDEIFLRMRQSPVIEIQVKKEERVKALISEYAELNADELKDAIRRIQKRLGSRNTRICLEAIDNKDFGIAVDYALSYYDKAYSKGLGTRQKDTLFPVELKALDTEDNAGQVLIFARSKGLLKE